MKRGNPALQQSLLQKLQPLRWVMAVCLLTVLLLSSSRGIAISLQSTLLLLGQRIIPSLFPFLLLGQFLTLPTVFSSLCTFFRWLRLPLPFAPLFLVSLVGGYPMGAILLTRLVAEKKIKSEVAGRLLPLLSFPSPSFVLAVGGRSGWHLLGALILGVIPLFFFCKKGFLVKIDLQTDEKNKEGIKLLSSLPFVIRQAGESLMGIVFAVLTAALIQPLLAPLPLSDGFLACLLGALEVCSGVEGLLRDGFGLLPATFFLAFGGCSVFLQIASIARFANQNALPLKFYLLTRPLYGLSSTLFLLLLLQIFPLSVQTGPSVSPLSATPVAAILFLLMIALTLCLTVKKAEG